MTPSPAREESLLNQSRILYRAGEMEFSSYSNTVSTPIVGPILQVVKSTAATQAFPGVPVVFAITINNSGNLAGAITIYDILQAGTSFVPNSVHLNGVPLPGADPVSGLYIGVLSPQQSVLVTFQLIADMQISSSTLSNQVRADYAFRTASGRFVDGQVFSNTVTIPVTRIGRPDITIYFTVNKTNASPGEILRYTARVINLGDVAADVILLSSIPNGTLFVRNSITLNGVMQSGDSVTTGIALGTIGPRQESIVTFDVMVSGTNVVTPGQLLNNQARTEGTYRNSDGTLVRLEPSVSSTTTTEVYYPLFKLEVSTTPAIVEPEDILDYTLLLTNIGNLAAEVTLNRLTNFQTTLVPGSIRINGVPAADPDASGNLYIGNVTPGTTIRITYRVRISPFVTSRVLRGVVTAQYEYELNDNEQYGEVNSNSYEIIIEHSHE